MTAAEVGRTAGIDSARGSGMTGDQFERELPRTHEAPWHARRWLGDWFGAELRADDLHRAKLLTSELVTNAVLHGRGRIVLGARLSGQRLLVEVSDEGTFPLAPSRRELQHLRGRGLAIVDAESSDWGVREGAARVWFELELSPAV